MAPRAALQLHNYLRIKLTALQHVARAWHNSNLEWAKWTAELKRGKKNIYQGWKWVKRRLFCWGEVQQDYRCMGGWVERRVTASGFLLTLEGSTLQHVAPMKTMCGPRVRSWNQMCSSSGVTHFVIYFPAWLTHSQVFAQLHLTRWLRKPPQCQCHETNSCTSDAVSNEWHVAYLNH